MIELSNFRISENRIRKIVVLFFCKLVKHPPIRLPSGEIELFVGLFGLFTTLTQVFLLLFKNLIQTFFKCTIFRTRSNWK